MELIIYTLWSYTYVCSDYRYRDSALAVCVWCFTAGDCDYEERAGQGQGASSGTAATETIETAG